MDFMQELLCNLVDVREIRKKEKVLEKLTAVPWCKFGKVIFFPLLRIRRND